MINGLSNGHARLLALALTLFFMTSVYISATRLTAYTFNRDTTATSSTAAERERPSKLKLTFADLPMSYGHYNRPPFEGLRFRGAVPEELVPTPENGRRLIVVGDIHGMDNALEALLEKVGFIHGMDHIVATGDMVAKGPDSPAVVDRLMALNASAVRGNHEDRILLAHRELARKFGAGREIDALQRQNRKGEMAELAVVRSLSQEHIDWLANLPVILTIDALRIYVVHAGLVPGVDLDNQDPWAVMNMRSLAYPREELRAKNNEPPRRRRRRDGDDVDDPSISFDRSVWVPLETPDGEMWFDAWNEYQMRFKKWERYTVLYGHDAKTGYKEGKYTFGLDSGCVKGKALTALVIEATEAGGFKQLMYQVPCGGL